MKRSILRMMLLLAVPLGMALYSCSDNSDETGVAFDPKKEVKITRFDPDSGRVRNMVLIDGENFGSDPNIVKVFFNHMEARVIGANKAGDRVMVLVPRMPGDECIISVRVGGKRVDDPDTGGYTYTGGKEANTENMERFRYRMAANVTTVAGNGSKDPRIYDQGLDKAQFWPVYIAMDKDENIFVNSDDNTFLRINIEQNLIQVLANEPDNQYQNNCAPNIHPHTNVVMVGANSSNPRDRFLFLDPRDGWAAKPQFIRSWVTFPEDTVPTYINSVTGIKADYASYSLQGTGEGHFYCLWSPYPEREVDAGVPDEKKVGWYYTRYGSGQLVRVDPVSWEATIIGMTISGTNYCAVFHPLRQWELWMGAGSEGNQGDWNNSLVTIDVRDLEFTYTENATTGVRARSILKSAKRMSSPFIQGAHRDGKIEEAQFKRIRQLGFDPDGNLYVGDCENRCLRMVTTMSEPMMVSTVIGIPGRAGWKDGSPDEALFRQVHGIVTDKEGTVYLSDWDNGRIRRIALE